MSVKLFPKIEENKLFGMFQWYVLSSLECSLDAFQMRSVSIP